MSNNFCIKPFNSTDIRTDGRIRVCCRINEKISKFNGKKEFNANKDSIKDFFNSDYIANLKQKFLNNEQPVECEDCWTHEKQGHRSLRMESNYLHKIVFTKNSKKYLKLLKLDNLSFPQDLLIEVTNLCNLKCQMCGGNNSSKLLVENNALGYEKLNQKDYEFHNFTWKNIEHILSHDSKLLTLVGGEPLMVPNIRKILQKCIDKKISKNIFLQIFTNGTLYDNEFKKILKNFKNVRLIFSIEGVGKYNEYIRYPSNWNIINQNIEKFKQENTTFHINSLVQNLNIMYIHKLIQWANKKKIFLKLDSIIKPDYLQYDNLPIDLLKKSHENLTSISKTESLTHIENFNAILNNLKNKIENYKLDKTRWAFFKKMIKARDNYRKISINDYLPELSKFL